MVMPLLIRNIQKKYLASEDLAKNDKLGLWIGSFQMPWEWRKEN